MSRPGRRSDLLLESSPLLKGGVFITPPGTTEESDLTPTPPDILGNVFGRVYVRNTPHDVTPKSNAGIVAPGPRAVSQHHQSAPLARARVTTSPQRAASFRLAELSEDDIRNHFFIPGTAYIEEPGKHTIHASWRTYLESNNLAFAFLPLRGTERDRYRPIIQEAEAYEMKKGELAVETLKLLLKLLLKDPDGEAPLKDRHDKLAEYLQRAPRHDRQHPEFHRVLYKTNFGVLPACFVLPVSHWYLGHRPGDPIVRIRTDPIARGSQEDDMFYVPDLAGSKDGDEAKTYNICVEGVVPFNAWELLQRFTRFAFPTLVQMAIAAVAFDPRDQEYKPHPWAREVAHIQTSEFREITERDRAGNLKLLRRIWRIKYGTDMTSYPQFLKDQISTSSSSLREMGWLMCKLETEAPGITHHHYWNHCKGLLADISGRNASLLAREYVEITLAREAEELLEDGDVENILIYWRSQESDDMAIYELHDLYNIDGPEPEVSTQEINDLREQTIKLLVGKKEGLTESPPSSKHVAAPDTSDPSKKRKRPSRPAPPPQSNRAGQHSPPR